MLKRIVRVWCHIEHVEMAHISMRYSISSNRWEHGSSKCGVDCLSEFLLNSVDIIPSLVVHPLAKKLNWWLSTILLFHRHVEIVNKDNAFFSKWWAINTLSLFLHLSINDHLCLLRCCLRREGKTYISVVFILEFCCHLIHD